MLGTRLCAHIIQRDDFCLGHGDGPVQPNLAGVIQQSRCNGLATLMNRAATQGPRGRCLVPEMEAEVSDESDATAYLRGIAAARQA
jgi:hypothetical protein